MIQKIKCWLGIHPRDGVRLFYCTRYFNYTLLGYKCKYCGKEWADKKEYV